LEIIPVSVNWKLMLFVPTSISIKLNLTVPLYQWQATNFTCKVSSIVLRAASWVSLHGAFSVYVFHSTSYLLMPRTRRIISSAEPKPYCQYPRTSSSKRTIVPNRFTF
jgi:hypothetical protein